MVERRSCKPVMMVRFHHGVLEQSKHGVRCWAGVELVDVPPMFQFRPLKDMLSACGWSMVLVVIKSLVVEAQRSIMRDITAAASYRKCARCGCIAQRKSDWLLTNMSWVQIPMCPSGCSLMDKALKAGYNYVQRLLVRIQPSRLRTLIIEY